MARHPAKTALALINRKSGTVRTRGADAMLQLVKDKLEPRFPKLDVAFIRNDIADEIASALASGKYHTIIAGGGDGTISSAALALLSSDVAMGALPLGTMNLFVRALGFAPTLEQALDQLAASQMRSIDVGIVNDRVFLHQVSFGLQPRLARLRERIGYKSRLTKMLSGLRALTMLAANPRQVRIDLEVDGQLQSLKVPLVIVSNNRLGKELNFSLQSSLTNGELGLYALKHFSFWTLIGLARDHLANRLIVNPALDMMTAQSITVKPRRHRITRRKPRSILASIDGEVARLKYPVEISLKPQVLKVLAVKTEADARLQPRP
jgi:diacylglycerol kinase family enzyme